ncbi:hypothetical protein [Paenibacillus harenae]|uniref:hypothetical protein n=1 Tax=Paenibacillus harenae TaxID=306543 RepID=UPI00279334CF|nr:hypothetical protein [Paenibacillus harenae]MDQ0063880.1 hypothetical protein [Paenibacillus harenae]
MSAIDTMNRPLPSEGIRTWRVGSLSMGVTLMMIGTALAVSIWQDIEAYEMLLWVAPIVFILLGLELLLYLKFSGSDRAIVRYDWISVFFVGLIGTASLGLALLMSTGLFDELQRGLQVTQRSVFVEPHSLQVPDNVNKVIVQSIGGVDLGETDTREAKLFGQVRYWSAEPIGNPDKELMQTTIVGNTLYIVIGTLDRRDGGLVTDTYDSQLTLVLPKGLEIERRGY